MGTFTSHGILICFSSERKSGSIVLDPIVMSFTPFGRLWLTCDIERFVELGDSNF